MKINSVFFELLVTHYSNLMLVIHAATLYCLKKKIHNNDIEKLLDIKCILFLRFIRVGKLEDTFFLMLYREH